MMSLTLLFCETGFLFNLLNNWTQFLVRPVAGCFQRILKQENLQIESIH